MSLAEAIKAEIGKKRSLPCCAARALDGLSPVDRAALDDAVAGGLSVTVLHRALESEGVECKYDALRKHVTKACSCGTR